MRRGVGVTTVGGQGLDGRVEVEGFLRAHVADEAVVGEILAGEKQKEIERER